MGGSSGCETKAFRSLVWIASSLRSLAMTESDSNKRQHALADCWGCKRRSTATGSERFQKLRYARRPPTRLLRGALGAGQREQAGLHQFAGALVSGARDGVGFGRAFCLVFGDHHIGRHQLDIGADAAGPAQILAQSVFLAEIPPLPGAGGQSRPDVFEE